MPNAIPVRKAIVCVNCDTVNDGRTCCACCGSSSVFNLARVLNRPTAQANRRRHQRMLLDILAAMAEALDEEMAA